MTIRNDEERRSAPAEGSLKLGRTVTRKCHAPALPRCAIGSPSLVPTSRGSPFHTGASFGPRWIIASTTAWFTRFSSPRVFLGELSSCSHACSPSAWLPGWPHRILFRRIWINLIDDWLVVGGGRQRMGPHRFDLVVLVRQNGFFVLREGIGQLVCNSSTTRLD
jgi:hypothetical protein